MTKLRVLSGIQPSGKLHIGNYLGAVQNWIKLQAEYESFWPIVDMHAITENYRPEEKPGQILETITDLLASGIDPEKSVVFIQSHVPEHAELAWYFNTITPMSFLERMTQYKDKAARQQANINVGLFDYPVLMAADILLYKPAAIPVGEDQVQHVELTNDIVKKFNNRFGQTFSQVKALLTKTPRVMSILDPQKKMSKSEPNGCIFMSDEPAVIEKKLARAVTDTGKEKTMSPGVANLFKLLEIFGEESQYQFYLEAHKAGTIRYAELKGNLAKVIAHHFAPYREKKRELAKKPEYIKQVIAAGREKAKAIASQTLREVKEKIGLIV